MRTALLIAFAAATFTTICFCSEEAPTAALNAEIASVLRKQFPDAELSRDKKDPEMLYFSHNTREFVIYRALKTGEWQSPSTVLGPDKGGLIVQFSVRKGKWKGALMVPYSGTEDLYVFNETLVVRNAGDGSCHLWARVVTPRFEAPSEVAAQLVRLLNAFPIDAPVKKPDGAP